jgi:hypothetical protein
VIFEIDDACKGSSIPCEGVFCDSVSLFHRIFVIGIIQIKFKHFARFVFTCHHQISKMALLTILWISAGRVYFKFGVHNNQKLIAVQDRFLTFQNMDLTLVIGQDNVILVSTFLDFGCVYTCNRVWRFVNYCLSKLIVFQLV